MEEQKQNNQPEPQQEEQKQQDNQPKISKRQQKKMKLEQGQETLTKEEIEAQRQKIFESLTNPCEGCKVKEGKYSLRQVKALCENCFQRKIYNRIYLHIRGKVPLGAKLLVSIVGNHFPDQLTEKNNPLARDYLVFETMFGKSKNGTKQLHQVEILYIDLGCIRSKSTVMDWGQKTNVKVNVVDFQTEFFGGDIEKMAEFFKLFKDSDELIKILAYNLTMNFSEKNDFQQVFLSDCGQDIAKNTFGLFAQGRGLSVIQEINAVTKTTYRGKQYNVFRMLKDIVESEVQGYYNMVQEQIKLQGNETGPKIPENYEKSDQEKQLEKLFGLNAAKKPTIEKILGNFFEKLQETFPSTVHTALRSFDKVEDKFKQSQNPCYICLGKMDKIVNQLELDSYEELGKSQVQNIEGICFGCMRMIKNSNSDIDTIMKSMPKMILDNKQQ